MMLLSSSWLDSVKVKCILWPGCVVAVFAGVGSVARFCYL